VALEVGSEVVEHGAGRRVEEVEPRELLEAYPLVVPDDARTARVVAPSWRLALPAGWQS
jgi:hypothetical protein